MSLTKTYAYNTTVISAIATAQGPGGVAIVRMSGEGALQIARAMCGRETFEPNRMYPAEIDGGTLKDFGLVVWFKAPRSFTGEDVVEFHCHGGSEIARAVLKRTLALGARLAGRGEFTKRAFLNGKLSLSAAEGMADMINASSEAEVRAGYLLYGETLANSVRRMQAQIMEALAGVEADLDFPEEDLNASSRAQTEATMSEVEASLSSLLGQYRAGRRVKDGVRVAIAGRPNAGKSSLFNALLGYGRTIVSPAAGTTRDTVEETLLIHGVRFLITDTAGLRESGDAVEQEGIRRAEQAIRAADLIVYLKEEGDEPCFPAQTPVVTVGAKCDVKRETGCEIYVSSRTGEGIEALKECIYTRGFGRENDGAFLMEERHFGALKRAHAGAVSALGAIRGGLPPELYAEELRAAYSALGEITGETATEAVVSAIFEKFCVGK